MLFEIDAASNPCPPRGMETGRLLPMSSARCGSRSRRGSGSRWCAYGERGSWAAHTSTDTAFRPTWHTCRTRPGSGPRSAYAARCSPSPGPSVRPKRLRCRAPRPCRARRSHRPKPAFRKVIMDGDRRSDGRYLEISASACPEGATLDCGGGHRPMVLVRLLWQRLVPMCPGVILDRATSRAVLRTRGAGTSAHQQARPRRR